MAETPASERAYEVTKEMVITGELPGGLLLSEGEIAERLGVSRTPVREAFLRLQAEGLLTLIPKRGAVVVPIAPDEADDVLDAREAVECAAVRRIVGRPAHVPAVVAALRSLLREQERHSATHDVDAFANVDALFHRAIVEAGKNSLMLRFYASLSDRQRRMGVRAFSPDPALMPEALRNHRQLVSAIEQLDVEAFTEALRGHLNGIHRR
jgi:DNA-binding GntR family transcriptional regulator